MRLWVRALERERLARPVDKSFAPLCGRAARAPTFSLLLLSAILTSAAEAPTNIVFRGMANAEALVAFGSGDERRLLLLADEGDARHPLRTFRGRWFTPP